VKGKRYARASLSHARSSMSLKMISSLQRAVMSILRSTRMVIWRRQRQFWKWNHARGFLLHAGSKEEGFRRKKEDFQRGAADSAAAVTRMSMHVNNLSWYYTLVEVASYCCKLLVLTIQGTTT
jgi:hypothetical protein